MPGLLNAPTPASSSPPPRSNAIWSKKRDDITFDQLQKFWSELPVQARQELLRIDKQALFEQARKNLYCSRCNGLLLEGFSQIVMYGKSLQQEVGGYHLPNRTWPAPKTHIDAESDEVQDPLVHPWGGLAATRDNILTVLDCFISARSLKALQNVFDSARARERERELLYPDACGGGGRGWISQGMTNYGRGHGSRETCALHTARLSCDTLVDFWSALGEETRTSLLRMKEEDFIERLMYRFDSKRFCRDCRRNVIREFKELKELKRMRRELRCTSWFCVADTAFQYEVSEDTVYADWHQSFTDTVGTYHHFEWAIGTGEGKSDILEFEDVGMKGKVQVNGLDLAGLSACFITLRAWKLDGRCTEICVKAHALKGQPCVHHRLVIGDGLVTITKGEGIRRFFEHAEEAEEEEDDDALDKDGNEIDGDDSRPQKHAKSPELAREFLLDAATVIFKEQVEKAFREGTARQNAHSIFVSLALKLLEERLHVACKEINTLEMQIKLLEEEEKEKREEEERREKRRAKEREKKLRRKERLKGKERERERKHNDSNSHVTMSTSSNDSHTSTHDDSSPTTVDSADSVSDPGELITPQRPSSPDIKDDESSNGCGDANNMKSGSLRPHCHVDEAFGVRDNNGSFILEKSKSSRRKLRLKNDTLAGQASKWYGGSVRHDECDSLLMDSSRLVNGGHRVLRERFVKANTRNCKYHCSSSRTRDRFDFQSCSCSQNADYRPKDRFHMPTTRSVRVIKTANKTESTVDMPRQLYRGSKYGHGCFLPGTSALPKGKLSSGTPGRDIVHTRQVWEPMDARRKGTRSTAGSDVSSRADAVANPCEGIGSEKADGRCSPEISGNLSKDDTLSSRAKFSLNGRKRINKKIHKWVEMGEEAAAAAADEPGWFARWEEELPSPEELMPLSQTLITPDLALAFDIHTLVNTNHNPTLSTSVSNRAPPPPPPPHLHHHPHHHLPPPTLQSDFDSADLGSSGPGADEPARTLKRPRLVWTPQLHKRFVEAVAHLGIKNAVPKTIMQLMSVDGLTRENVASHLQKYRLYLKRMQGISSSCGGGAGRGSPGPMSAADAATDQLFASGPIPHHFLNGGGHGGHVHGVESYVPFVPMSALQHHQQMAAAQQQFYHQRHHLQQHQLGHFGSSTAGGGVSSTAGGGVGGGFDHGLLTRATSQAGLHRLGPGGPLHSVVQPVRHAPLTAASYADDLEGGGGGGGGGRKVLTLFPTGED